MAIHSCVAILTVSARTPATTQVEIHDSESGELVRTLSYSSGSHPQHLLTLPIRDGRGGTRVVGAVLRQGVACVVSHLGSPR